MIPLVFGNRTTKHLGKSVVTAAHLHFEGLSLRGELFRALLALYPEATDLYLEGTQLRAEVRSRLERGGIRPATAIPAGTGWPDNWYEMMSVRVHARAMELVIALADEYGVAALGRTGSLFWDEVPVAEWRASESNVDVLAVSMVAPPSRLTVFERRLGVTPSRREGAS